MPVTNYTDIINSSIDRCYFPNIWKNANIVPIEKPGKPIDDPLSYRPISLLPILSKLYEKVIQKRIEETGIQITQDEQCGFKKQHSTVHQLTKITQDIATGFTQGCNRHKSTVMILLDVEKAFDRVWRDGLIYKLIKLGLPRQIVKITKSYMEGRTFQVLYKKSKSNRYVAEAGVVQGSILGPLLFNAFIHDMPETKMIKKGLYADDTALYRTGNFTGKKEIRLMQKDLDSMSEFFSKWKIKINSGKTQGIVFTYNRKMKHIHTLTFHSQGINWTKNVKYLGTYLDSRLTWQKNTHYMSTKARIGLAKIHRLIHNKSKLNIKLKTLLYKSIVRPVISYAPSAWHAAATTHHTTENTNQPKPFQKTRFLKFGRIITNDIILIQIKMRTKTHIKPEGR
ncbi:hypothetical protein M8J76_002286 [Diaphorina citri]|nr:hypothetical protein M8J76_002286 [Diaphorina citri]